MSPDNSLDQHVVTAVVVAHDGAGWIPRMAEGVLQQTRPVQRAVAVDTGSRDRSGVMLAGLFGRAAVFGMERGTGYAAAVTHALRHRAANSHVPGAPQRERVEWVWLIHDDCEPAPDALEQLLRAATETPGAAILGPKVRDWTDQRVILEAGLTIDRAGRRITGLEPREVDQGQHDGDRDVLAVGSAGMLIRRDVWDQLGGFDTGMKLFREDADFCWRAQAAGHRVRVVTDAVVYHMEASARNRRAASAAPRPRRQDRRNALIVLLGNLPAGPMLRVLAGNILLSVLRTMFYLVAKRPGAGADEFSALLSVGAHPFRLLSARRPRARGRRAAYGRLRRDLPPGRTLGRLAEFIGAALSKSAPVDTIGSHHATEDPSDDDSLLTDSGFAQRLLTSPGVLLFLALTAIALVAERSLFGGGPLAGGALQPAWGGASGLWQEYLQGFHPAGIGTAVSTPPYVAVLAFLATLLAGKTWLAVDVLMIGCVPLAGMAAFLVARRITRFAPAQMWAGAAYALLPVGMGAVAAGRLGSAVVFILLPLIGLLAARIFTEPRRRARRAAWAAALLTAVAAAFVPLTWLLVGVVAGVAALAFGRSRPGMGLNLAIVAVVPPLLLLPWSLQVFTSPATLFLESGLQQPGLAQAGLPARSLLLLSPGGPGLPAYWVTAGLVLVALVSVLGSGRRVAVQVGWGVALAGMLTAVAVSRLIVTPPGGGPAVAAWPGALLAFAGAGLVLVVAAAGDWLPGALRAGRWRAPAGLGVLALAAVASSAPLLAAASWVMTGLSGPIGRAGAPVLPEFVTVSSSTALHPRTLVLRPGAHGTVSYEVLRSTDPLLGASALTPPPAAARALSTAVAALVAPGGNEAQDQGRVLASFGIGYVLLPAPGSPALARLLDGIAGLRTVSQTSSFELWRVLDTVAQVRVVESGGKVVPVASQPVGVPGARLPAAGGELVLAEPAGGWSASVNGHPLTPATAPVGGWAQGFQLPPGGGTLTVSHSQLGRDAVVLLEALAVLAVFGLGLPGARVAGEEAAGAAAESRRGPAGTRTASGRAADRQPSHRGRAGAVPEPRGTETGMPADTSLAGLGAGVAAGAAAGYQPGQADSGPMAAARARRGEEDSARVPGRPGRRAGYADEPTALTSRPDRAPGRGYPAGGHGLAPLPPAGGRPGEDPAGFPDAEGPDDPGRSGGRGGRLRKRAGLLGRGRGEQDGPEDGAGPLDDGGRRGRGGKASRDGAAQPGGTSRRRLRGADDRQPGAGAGRRAAAGDGEGPPAGGYPGGYPAEDYPAGDYPAGERRPGSRRGDDRGDYGSGGYGAGDYGSGGYPAGAGGSGSYRAAGYGGGDHGSGGYPAAAGGSGGYPAGGYGGGDYGAGDRGGGYGGGDYGAGGGGSGGYPAGPGGSGGYPAGQGRGNSGGRSGARSRGSGGQRDGEPGTDEGARRGRRGLHGRTDARRGDDRGDARRGDARRAGRGRGGDYPAGDYRDGDYPAGSYGTGGSGSGGYPAGAYEGGREDDGSHAGGRAGGGRLGRRGRGGRRDSGSRDTGSRDTGSRDTGSRSGASRGGPGDGGYGPGDYGSGGYPAGAGGSGGYPAGGYGGGDRGGGDRGGGGYPAGGYPAGGYGGGDYGSGGYPAGAGGSGGYPTGGDGPGDYGSGGYPAGAGGGGGYPAGGYGTGDYGDYGSGSYPAGDYPGGYGPAGYGDEGYGDEGHRDGGRGGEAGSGRRGLPPGRGKQGRGRLGRRPGRGDR